MAPSKNKILLLVEGSKTEPYLMEMYANALKEDFELNVIEERTGLTDEYKLVSFLFIPRLKMIEKKIIFGIIVLVYIGGYKSEIFIFIN